MYEYNTVDQMIQSMQFDFRDFVNFNGSWVEAASYFHCPSGGGFLYLHTRSGSYMFQNVDQVEWEHFKNLETPGEYYHKRFKDNGRYALPKWEGSKRQCSAINKYNDYRCERHTYKTSGRCWQH